MSDPRIRALERLGAHLVECRCCGAKLGEGAAIYLRRLWIDKERGSREQGKRLMFYACSRLCAQAIVEEGMQHVREHDGDSAFWIDDSHLTAEDS